MTGPLKVELTSPLTRARPADAAGERRESWQRLDLDRKHGRKIAHDGRPGVAGIGGGIHLAAGGAEIYAAFVE